MQVEDYILRIDARLAAAGFDRLSPKLSNLDCLRIYRRERVFASLLKVITVYVVLPGPPNLTISGLQWNSLRIYDAVNSAFQRPFWSVLVVSPLLLFQTVPDEFAAAVRDKFRPKTHMNGVELPVLVDLTENRAHYAESGISNNNATVYYCRQEARTLFSFSTTPKVIAGEPEGASLRRPLVFVSYRREDSADATGRLCDRLTERFGREGVFQDVDSIPLGVDFRRHIEERVGACRVLLAVIGRHWLVVGEPGRRRLDDPDDFVRVEIESALARGVPVIPVLVGGACMPAAEELPASLQGIVFRNGIPIRPNPDFHDDVDRLLRGLSDMLSEPSR